MSQLREHQRPRYGCERRRDRGVPGHGPPVGHKSDQYCEYRPGGPLPVSVSPRRPVSNPGASRGICGTGALADPDGRLGIRAAGFALHRFHRDRRHGQRRGCRAGGGALPIPAPSRKPRCAPFRSMDGIFSTWRCSCRGCLPPIRPAISFLRRRRLFRARASPSAASATSRITSSWTVSPPTTMRRG